MAKRIITAAEVEAAVAAGSATLAVPTDECIVTPQARDRAEALSVRLDEGSPATPAAAADQAAPPEGDEGLIKEVGDLLAARLGSSVEPSVLLGLVRQVVAERAAAPAAKSGGPGMRLLGKAEGARPVAALPAVPDKALLTEAFSPVEGAGLAAGVLEWEQGSFSRIVTEPEVVVVIEGELRLSSGGQSLAARAGDLIYLPRGAEVACAASSRVRLACVNRLP